MEELEIIYLMEESELLFALSLLDEAPAFGLPFSDGAGEKPEEYWKQTALHMLEAEQLCYTEKGLEPVPELAALLKHIKQAERILPCLCGTRLSAQTLYLCGGKILCLCRMPDGLFRIGLLRIPFEEWLKEEVLLPERTLPPLSEAEKAALGSDDPESVLRLRYDGEAVRRMLSLPPEALLADEKFCFSASLLNRNGAGLSRWLWRREEECTAVLVQGAGTTVLADGAFARGQLAHEFMTGELLC